MTSIRSTWLSFKGVKIPLKLGLFSRKRNADLALDVRNAPADRLQGVTVQRCQPQLRENPAPCPALPCVTAQPRLSEKHLFTVTIPMAQKFRCHEGRTASERLAPESSTPEPAALWMQPGYWGSAFLSQSHFNTFPKHPQLRPKDHLWSQQSSARASLLVSFRFCMVPFCCWSLFKAKRVWLGLYNFNSFRRHTRALGSASPAPEVGGNSPRLLLNTKERRSRQSV